MHLVREGADNQRFLGRGGVRAQPGQAQRDQQAQGHELQVQRRQVFVLQLAQLIDLRRRRGWQSHRLIAAEPRLCQACRAPVTAIGTHSHRLCQY